jgi:hypothetical protein
LRPNTRARPNALDRRTVVAKALEAIGGRPTRKPNSHASDASLERAPGELTKSLHPALGFRIAGVLALRVAGGTR